MLARQFVLIGLKSKPGCNVAGSRCSALNFRLSQNFSTNENSSPKICVIGSGPAGFYATQFILKTLTNAKIDIVEKLPVPYGLVRYENIQEEFSQVLRVSHI